MIESLSFDETLSALRAASERTRLRLLIILQKSELTVSELTRILGQSAPRVSRHLKVLFDNHLIERNQEGTWVFYRVVDRGPALPVVRALVDLVPTAEFDIQKDMERLEMVQLENREVATAYFERNAKKWDEICQRYVPETKIENVLLEMLDGRNIENLLDVGTGTGRMLEVLGGSVTRGLGIDLNPEMLAVARMNLRRSGLRHCQVRQGDLYNLKVENRTVDLVVLHQVLHFLDDPAAAIRESVRTLVPGGVMIIVDFSPHKHEFLRTEHTHRRLGFSDKEIITWLADSGASLKASRRLDVKEPETPGENLTVSIWMAGV